MILSSAKKEGPRLVSTLAELSELVEARTRAKVVLGGELVLASLTGHVAGVDYIKQPARSATRGGLFFQQEKSKLQVWLSKETVALMAKAGSRIQASLSIDHYLRWGLKQKEPEFILFGGDANPDKSILLVMHFKKGSLIKLGEKSLPGRNNPRFFSEVYPLIEHAHNEVPGAQLYWAAPLPEVRTPFITRISEEVMMGRTGFVVSGSGKASLLAQHGFGASLVALGLAGYLAAAGYPYLKYQRAAAQFEQESAQLKGDFQFAADRLKLLQERKAFLGVAEQNASKMAELEELLLAAAENQYPIQEAILNLKKDTKPGARKMYDFEVALEQPKDPSLTAIEQAAPIISTLSARMHTPLHLSPTMSHQETETQRGQFKRVYRIEGDLRAHKAN
jgi:hypothetical protein